MTKHTAGMTNRQAAISKHTQTPVSTTNTYICTSTSKKAFKTHRENKRPRNTYTIDKNYTHRQTHSHTHWHRQTHTVAADIKRPHTHLIMCYTVPGIPWGAGEKSFNMSGSRQTQCDTGSVPRGIYLTASDNDLQPATDSHSYRLQ